MEDDTNGFQQLQYVWSLAYVDAPLDNDQGYSGPRHYAVEDANWNVIRIVDTDYVLYDPYGKPSKRRPCIKRIPRSSAEP